MLVVVLSGVTTARPYDPYHPISSIISDIYHDFVHPYRYGSSGYPGYQGYPDYDYPYSYSYGGW